MKSPRHLHWNVFIATSEHPSFYEMRLMGCSESKGRGKEQSCVGTGGSTYYFLNLRPLPACLFPK